MQIASALEEAQEVFERLLAMTPAPQPQCDAEELIVQAEDLLAERAVELAILSKLLQKNPTLLVGNVSCRAYRDELALLDRQWESALARAKQELSRRRQASQQARQRAKLAQSAYR